MEKKRIGIHHCAKGYTVDQDKVCSPVETVERFLARLREIDLDILKEVRRIDTGRLDVPVFFSVCGRDAHGIIGAKKQMGKGSSPEQARASACMELAERFSFFSFAKDSDNFLIGDYAAMEAAGHPLLGLDVLLASVHDHGLSPETLRELLDGLPLRWTWATNLSRDKEVLVPFSWFYAINEFNGPSAGNSSEEAILQGIAEVVERHVCARITRERLATPAIDPDSVSDPVARELLDKFARNGIEVYLNDFSLDTGIPTVGALAWDPATFPDKSEIVYTAGTTPGADKALIRALTEVAQLAGDFEMGANYVASGLPKPLSLDEVDYVVKPAQRIPISAMTDLADADFGQELRNCLAALGRIGLEILVIDTMHPKLRIPAVYTIMPGGHFRERAASGDAALFAAKLAAELLEGCAARAAKFEQMALHLPGAYYLTFYQGRNLHENDMPEEALACFERSLAMGPRPEDLPYVHSFRGACLRDLGRWNEAVAALEQGLAEDEERPDIHNMLGVCHFKQGRHEQAVRHFERAVELNPASAIDYANLGINLQRLGRRDKALRNYEIALSLDPAIEFAARGMAELLEQE